MTGTIIAQAIPVLSTPILTRLYSPQDFGIFAVYMSILAIMGIFATGRYEIAIMQPKLHKNADQLLWLALLVSLIISLVGLVFIIFFKEYVIKLLGNPNNENIVYMIPLSIMLVTLYNGLTQWLNRNKHYKQMSFNRISQSLLLALFSIIFIAINNKIAEIGLLLAHTIAYSISFYLLYKSKSLQKLTKFKFKNMLILAKKYDRYPKIDLFASGFNILAQQSPVLFLTAFMGAIYAGPYYMVERLLALPVGILSSSIGSVFREQATYEKHQSGGYDKIFIATLKKLFFFGFPIFLILFFLSPYLFVWFLGDKWVEAGKYAQILIPMFFFKFLVSPLSYSFYISDKLDYDLYGQILFFLGIAFSFAIGYFYDNVYFAIIGTSISGSLTYLLFLFISFKLSKVNK